MSPQLLEGSTSGELPDLKKKGGGVGECTGQRQMLAERRMSRAGRGENTTKAEVSSEKWPRSAREGESPGDQNRSRKQ